jgi:hypothetical protein
LIIKAADFAARDESALVVGGDSFVAFGRLVWRLAGDEASPVAPGYCPDQADRKCGLVGIIRTKLQLLP